MVALCAPSLSSAQELGGSKTEVFSGYSWYRAGGGGINGTKLPNFTEGWGGQLIYQLDERGAFVVDVNSHSNGSSTAYDFALGGRYQHPVGHFFPFFEALTGVQHLSPKGLCRPELGNVHLRRRYGRKGEFQVCNSPIADFLRRNFLQ